MKADDRLSRWNRRSRLRARASKLQKGDRVFITFDDHAQYHSPSGEEPDEFDDISKLALANLALVYGCAPKLEYAERRIYFSKIS
jgi:hypothetical protein